MANKRVLIVDDEKDIAEVMKIALDGEYEIFVLHTIADTIDEIKTINPDVILLDLWIPEIGGEKVLGLLKSDAHMKEIPVIIVSADNRGSEISKENGADDFLAKPFKIKELKELIRKALNT